MSREKLEVADVFRAHGQHWRDSHAGHASLEQLKVMSAVEHCRTEVLGGHVLYCPACEHVQIAYNSCRNRHCPKCQASAAKRWLAARQTEMGGLCQTPLCWTASSIGLLISIYP